MKILERMAIYLRGSEILFVILDRGINVIFNNFYRFIYFSKKLAILCYYYTCDLLANF
jgi:hypothetical protein